MSALCLLSICFFAKGEEGAEKKFHRAMERFEYAVAEGGHVRAMNVLGLFLVAADPWSGKGRSSSYMAYERAIEGGNVDAMEFLGTLLTKGKDGVEKDIY